MMLGGMVGLQHISNSLGYEFANSGKSRSYLPILNSADPALRSAMMVLAISNMRSPDNVVSTVIYFHLTFQRDATKRTFVVGPSLATETSIERRIVHGRAVRPGRPVGQRPYHPGRGIHEQRGPPNGEPAARCKISLWWRRSPPGKQHAVSALGDGGCATRPRAQHGVHAERPEAVCQQSHKPRIRRPRLPVSDQRLGMKSQPISSHIFCHIWSCW